LWTFVLGALLATLWFAGPRAANTLAARYQLAEQQSPPVELDRVGFLQVPDWMDPPQLVTVTRELSPWLSDQVPILDDASARNLRTGLLTVPWVDEVRLDRVFPNQFKIALVLRRPRLAVRDAEGQAICLVDAGGRALPWVECQVPSTQLRREGGAGSFVPEFGRVVDESRVRAALAIALEWQQEVAPLVPGCPQLLAVDANNLGERYARSPSFPEIRVLLQRRDGAPVTFLYGRPVDSPLPRVSARAKAQVLANILQLRPGLDGLVSADLRLSRRWLDYLQPREPGRPDPLAPWTALDGELPVVR
jgi:hypothetical protein